MIMDRPKPTPSKRLNLDQLAASPAKRLRLFPDRTSDANASSSPNSGRRSPDEKCPICISEIKDRSFAGQCLHEFCFLCLFEWCKVKPECPVCRQAFTHIITNVTAIDKYDEVPVPTVPMLMSDSINSTQNPSVFPSRLANWDLNFIRIDLISALNHMRSATHDIPNAAEPTASSSDLASRNLSRDPVNVRFNEIGQFIDNLQSTRSRNWMSSEPIVRIEPLPTERDPSFVPPVGTTAFRRHVYENDLYVLPYGNGDSARFRRCSPSLYKANPAWTHRLMHFLKVELMAIVDNLYERQLLTSMIMYSLRKYDILSVQFKIMVEPYIGPRTEHFIHEFYNFARSCYELDNYNRIAVYVPKSEATISKTITTQPVYVVEDSDSEDVPVAIEATPASTMTCDNAQNTSRLTQAIKINPSNSGRVEMLVNLDFEVSRTSQPETQQSASTSSRPEEDEASDNDFTNPKPGPSGLNRFSSNSNLSNIRRNYYDDSDDDSDFEQSVACPSRVYPVKREHFESDDDSIEIIGVIKPIHERTPELIELTDDEDEIDPSVDQSKNQLKTQNDQISTRSEDEKMQSSNECKRKDKKRSKKSKKNKKEKNYKRSRKHHKTRRHRTRPEVRASIAEMMSDDESIDIPLNSGRPKSFIGRVLMPSSQASNLNESRSPSPSIYLNLSSAANVSVQPSPLLPSTSSATATLSSLSSLSSISSVSSASSLSSSSRSATSHPSSVSEACSSAKLRKRSRHSSSSSSSTSLSSSSSSSYSSSSSSSSRSSSSFTSDRTVSRNSSHSSHSSTEDNRNTATLISDSLAVINNINRNVNLALNRLPSVIGTVNFNRKANP